MQRDGRDFKVVIAPDGEGLVSHAGSALLAGVAEKSGLTRALSLELSDLKQRRSGHDQGRVIRDLAVMLADGGDCLADLGALGDQESLFGDVASTSTAFRLVDRIARDREGLEMLRAAHAAARAACLGACGCPGAFDDRLGCHAHRLAFGEGGRGRQLQGRLRVSPNARLWR